MQAVVAEWEGGTPLNSLPVSKNGQVHIEGQAAKGHDSSDVWKEIEFGL